MSELARRLLRKVASALDNSERALAAARIAGHLTSGVGSTIDPRRVLIRNRCQVRIGDSSMVLGKCVFDRAGGTIAIGSRTYVASDLNCADNISIGDDVLISSGGGIFDHDSHALSFEDRARDVTDYIDGRKDWTNVPIRPVRIESRSWIGFGAIILKGVTIGEGAVVAAGSVVTKSVDPYTLVAGNPARPIRKLR